jgi:hypothetical protein
VLPLPEPALELELAPPLPERGREPAPSFLARAAPRVQAVPACHRRRRAGGSTTETVFFSPWEFLLFEAVGWCFRQPFEKSYTRQTTENTKGGGGINF